MSDYKPPLLMPMNIADILDASVRLYRSNFGPFMAIIAIVYVPMALFQVLLAFAMGRTMETMAGSSNMPSTESFVAMGGAYAGLLLVNVLAVPLAQGALSVAVIAIGWFVYSSAHRALEPQRRPSLNLDIPRALPPEGPKLPPPAIPHPK